MMTLPEKLKRVRQIGVDVTNLTAESKQLRSDIVEDLKKEGVIFEEGVQYKRLYGRTVVTIVKATKSSDFTILFEDFVPRFDDNLEL